MPINTYNCYCRFIAVCIYIIHYGNKYLLHIKSLSYHLFDSIVIVI